MPKRSPNGGGKLRKLKLKVCKCGHMKHWHQQNRNWCLVPSCGCNNYKLEEMTNGNSN